MANAEPSQNELIAAHIQAQKDQGVDFALASTRRRSIQEFCDKHPDAKPGSVAAAHKTQLAKLAKTWGASPSDFKAKARGKKKFDRTMNAKISESPADVGPESQGFRAGGAAPGQKPGAPPNQQNPFRPVRPEIYSVKTTGHIANTAYNVVAGGRKNARPLPPDVVESLGEVWVGPLNRLVYDHPYAEVAIAAIATLAIFARHAGIGKKKDKDERPDIAGDGDPEEEEPEPEPSEEEKAEEKKAKVRAQFGKAAAGESDY